MADTPNLKLPEIEHQEVNGDVTHNDGLWIMDMHGQSTVQNRTAVPPGSPNEGEAYIIAPGATGDWSGLDNQVAQRRGGIWNYYLPADGWRFYNATDTLIWKYNGSIWEIYIAGDVPPAATFQSIQPYETPFTTPTLTGGAWENLVFPSHNLVGTEFSYNNTTGDLTYTGANAICIMSFSIVFSGVTLADGDQFNIRIVNQAETQELVLSGVYITDKTIEASACSANLMRQLNTGDIIKLQIFSDDSEVIDISGGWYINRNYYV